MYILRHGYIIYILLEWSRGSSAQQLGMLDTSAHRRIGVSWCCYRVVAVLQHLSHRHVVAPCCRAACICGCRWLASTLLHRVIVSASSTATPALSALYGGVWMGGIRDLGGRQIARCKEKRQLVGGTGAARSFFLRTDGLIAQGTGSEG